MSIADSIMKTNRFYYYCEFVHKERLLYFLFLIKWPCSLYFAMMNASFKDVYD